MKSRSQLTIEECLKPHFKAALFHNYLKYVKKEYPEISIDHLFDDTPLNEKSLMDSSLWVSIKFERKFMENITRLVGKNIAYEVGQFGASEVVLDRTFKLLFSLLSVHDLISSLTKITTSLFNKVVKINYKSEKFRNIKIKLTPIFDNLDKREQQLLKESMSDMTANIAGYYEKLASLKGYINAKVQHDYSDLDPVENSKYLEIELGVLRLASTKNSYSLASFLFILNLTAYGLSTSYVPYTILSSIAIYFCFLFFNEKKQSLYFATEGQEALTNIEVKNQKLQASSLSIERKLLEFEVINRLLNESIHDSSISKTTQLATDSLVEKLGYDRSFIILKNSSGTYLDFQCQTGVTGHLVDIIKQFKLPVSNEKVFSEFQFSYLYNNQKSILVNDIVDHLNKLNDPVSIQLLKLSGTNSFICAPIAVGTNKYGLLIADKTSIDSKLSHSDVQILENMANQIGLALQRIELKNREVNLLNSYSKFVPF
ncbi:MAG: GAF domain-containing protein, partial [Pseudobdellovibrio sp.]